MLTVCTGWSPTGWEEYGRRFAMTFDAHWPEEVRLLVMGEEPRELCPFTDREYEFRALAEIPELIAFRASHDTPAMHGREKLPAHLWKERAIARGYNWRFDVMKFSKQVFIPMQALQWSKPGDLVCWLDGDVITHSKVPIGAIEALLPADKDIAFLGREPKHPEIGFQLYRAGSVAYAFLRAWQDAYLTDRFVHLQEWHSAYVWRQALRWSGTERHAVNLTPNGRGHVWHQSPLAQWTDHLKGDRKTMKQSPEAR